MMTYLKTNCAAVISFVSKTAQKLNLKVKFYKIHQSLRRSDGACSLAIVIQANIRGSQWGGVFYGYRLQFWLFYGYRLIFFSYG